MEISAEEKLRMLDVDQRQKIQYSRLFRAFLVRLSIAVAASFLIMVAVELYAYKRYQNTGTNVLELPVKLDLAGSGTAADRQYWKEFDDSNRVLYHQYVLWRRAPYRGEMISIDQDGVRQTLHTRCDDKTFTIWTFGDSVMWGAGTTDQDTIPSLIARDYEQSGKPVCIVNYAEKGWSSTQEMVGLIELLKHASRKPDIVLFYDGGTEAFAAYQNHEADVHSNFGLFSNFLDNWGKTQRAGFSYLRQTNTYRLLEKVADRVPFHRPPEVQNTPLDVERLSRGVIENYQENIAIIHLLGKQYGFQPIFAWYPNLAVGHKPLTDYEKQVLASQNRQFPGLAEMYEAVYNRSSEIRSPDFYNLADSVDDQKGSLYIGLSHMKPEGTRIMADHLFDILNGNRPTPGRRSEEVSSARPN
jgi:hypothetical protein